MEQLLSNSQVSCLHKCTHGWVCAYSCTHTPTHTFLALCTGHARLTIIIAPPPSPSKPGFFLLKGSFPFPLSPSACSKSVIWLLLGFWVCLFFIVTVGSLPYNIKQLEVIVTVIWCYNIHIHSVCLHCTVCQLFVISNIVIALIEL